VQHKKIQKRDSGAEFTKHMLLMAPVSHETTFAYNGYIQYSGISAPLSLSRVLGLQKWWVRKKKEKGFYST